MSESTNFTIDDPYLVEKKNLGKREVRKMLIVRENTSRKELLLDCSVIAHMFDEWHYFTSYISAQTAGQYITIGGHNYVHIAGHGSVKFWAKLSARILTIVLHNVIHVPCLRVNLVSIRALHRESVSVQSTGLGLVIEIGGDKLFYTMLTRQGGTLYQI